MSLEDCLLQFGLMAGLTPQFVAVLAAWTSLHLSNAQVASDTINWLVLLPICAISLALWWAGGLRARLFRHRLSHTQTAGTPERRGYPPTLKSFSSIEAVKDTLEGTMSQREEGARAKQRNRAHWGGVGDVEAATVAITRAGLASVPESLSVDAYVRACRDKLEELLTASRNSELDDDGYGLATLHAIKKCLHQPHGPYEID